MLLPSSCPVTIWLHLAIKTSQLQMGLVVICKEIGHLRMAINGPIQQLLVLQLIEAPCPQDATVPLGIAPGKARSE